MKQDQSYLGQVFYLREDNFGLNCKKNITFEISYKIVALFTENYPSFLLTEPMEEVFDDPLDKDGTNRTGVYILKIIPHMEIPELIPNRERVKIQHYQVARLCTGCYERHLRKDCKNGKISWSQYVRKFAHEFRSFQVSFLETALKGGSNLNPMSPSPHASRIAIQIRAENQK